MKRNTTKTGVFVPSDHHNGHLRGRGDSEPHPCFLLIVTCRKEVCTRTENRPPPTPAPCPKETNRTGGKREGDPHFAHAAIKKCLRSAHRKQQKCTFSHGQNPHLRSIDSSFRWRVAATLQNGAQRRTGRSHILIERAHVNFCRAARRGADCR